MAHILIQPYDVTQPSKQEYSSKESAIKDFPQKAFSLVKTFGVNAEDLSLSQFIQSLSPDELTYGYLSQNRADYHNINIKVQE